MTDAYVGEIRTFVGNYAPQDWLPCDGRLLTIQDNQLLFAVIGAVYGGDGIANFALPNLKGRLPIGTGQGPGLQNYALAAKGGADQVTLVTANLPVHSHAISASSGPATTASPGSGVTFAAVASNLRFYVDTTQGSVTGTATLNPADVSKTGGDQAHANVMSCMALTYIICVNGLYPTPN